MNPNWGLENYGVKIIYDSPKHLDLGAVDIENNKDGSFAGAGVYAGGTVAYYASRLETLDLPTRIIGHSFNTDGHKLRGWGVPFDPRSCVDDTQIAAFALDSTADTSLKDLAKNKHGILYPSFYSMVKKKKGVKTLAEHVQSLMNWTYDPVWENKRLNDTVKWDFQPSELPVELLAAYNIMDCYVTWLEFNRTANTTPAYYRTLNMPLSYVLFNMEELGVKFDQTKRAELQVILETRLAELQIAISNVLGPINLDSPKQLLEALQGIGLDPKWKGKPSTDKRGLAKFVGNPLIDNLLQFSTYSTLLTSYVQKYEAYGDSIIHPWFGQCKTRTARLACSNPNLQQIPVKTELGKYFRRMFVPTRKGYSLFAADFGQIEPRILAHDSKDKALCQMFKDGIDFHDFTSQRMGIDRATAKVLNLSVGYRATRFSVARQLKVDQWEAQRAIDKWWSMFPRLAEWEEQVICKARNDGGVYTMDGRFIPVDHLNDSDQFSREHAERMAINNKVQGTAGEINTRALIGLDNHGAELSISIHDEAVGEVQSHLAEMILPRYTKIMEECIKLDVPLVVNMKSGNNWEECK